MAYKLHVCDLKGRNKKEYPCSPCNLRNDKALCNPSLLVIPELTPAILDCILTISLFSSQFQSACVLNCTRFWLFKLRKICIYFQIVQGKNMYF